MKTDNELIAEFMGESTSLERFGENWEKILKLAGASETPNYHTSWDWLMPVVEKIRDLGGGLGEKENGLAYSTITVIFEANGHALGYSDRRFRASLLGNLVYKRMINSYQHTYDEVKTPHLTEYGSEAIPTLYKVVVEFIKWYNEQRQS